MRLPRLLILGASSAVLHVVVFVAQRAIHRGAEAAAALPLEVMLAVYVVATCGLFALYAAVVSRVAANRITTAGERRLALLTPVAFSLALLPTLPALSIDMYSYVARGYLQAELGQNPYLVGARAVGRTAFGHELAAYGWQPVHPVSPYGPLLEHLNRLVVGAAANVRMQILLLKAVTVAAMLASAALIWTILGRWRPEHQLLGTTVFLWNPLILWELAGDGHNDALMIALVLLALALILSHRHAAGITAMSLAVLTKYLPLMLVPLCVAYAWRTSRARERLVAGAALGGAVALAMTIALFLPLWVGLATFRGVQVNGAAGSTGSTPTIVLEVLERAVPSMEWQGAVWALTVGGLAICVTWQAWQVTNRTDLTHAAAVVWLLFLLIFCPTYWPWYGTTVIALVAIAPDARLFVVAYVVSFAGKLVAPLTMMYVHNFISRPVFIGTVWVIGLGVPLLVLARRRHVLVRSGGGSSAEIAPLKPIQTDGSR